MTKVLQGPKSINFFSMIFLAAAFSIFLTISAISSFSIQLVNEQLAQRCLEYVSQYDFYQFGIEEPVRVSVGISSTVSDKQDALAALNWQVDIAMYLAKRPGNRHIMHYATEMNDETGSVFSNRIITAVHRGITRGDNLVIYY